MQTTNDNGWIYSSFRYYDNFCVLKNIGGHIDHKQRRVAYRNIKEAVACNWHSYSGVWHVIVNNQLILATPIYDDALQLFNNTKIKLISLKVFHVD